MAKSAEQMAASWAAAMKSATTAQKYKDGINATTVNPMELAATDAAQQLYLTRVQESVSSGRRRSKLLASSQSIWKQNSINVGANALSTGATKAMSKVQAHFQRFGPAYEQARAAAAAIPKDGTTATALRKVEAAINVLKAAAGRS